MIRSLCLAAFLCAPLAFAESKPKLAFVGLRALDGVTEEQARGLSEVVQSELNRLGVYEVISSNDIAELLANERQKQLLGCTDESSNCMEELAGALNAQRMLTGQISVVGETAFFTLSLLDPRASRSVARVSRKVDGAKNIEPLFELLEPALYEMVNEDPLHGEVTLKPEKRFGGLSLGVRAEFDILGPRVAPAITVEFSHKWIGAAATFIIKGSPGARLEARFFPFYKGRVRPWLAVGATAFPTGVALRGALGTAVRFGNLHVFLDAGYERFVVAADGFLFDAVVMGGGVAWAF